MDCALRDELTNYHINPLDLALKAHPAGAPSRALQKRLKDYGGV